MWIWSRDFRSMRRTHPPSMSTNKSDLSKNVVWTICDSGDKILNMSEKFVGLLLIGIYVVLRMFADALFWRNISEYYSYAFELGFVAAAYFVFRKRIRLFKVLERIDAIAYVVMIAEGFLVFRLADCFGVPIPFDLSGSETIFLLLLLAPTLEELIF